MPPCDLARTHYEVTAKLVLNHLRILKVLIDLDASTALTGSADVTSPTNSVLMLHVFQMAWPGRNTRKPTCRQS